MPVTFPVSKVEKNQIVLDTVDTQAAIGKLLKKKDPEAWGMNKSKLTPDLSGATNGLINAAHIAYGRHYSLVLSPDDIWTAIAQGFANHVDMNAEKLRKQFVSHEGQVELVIHRDGFKKGSATNDWMGGFSEFSDKIAEHIGKKRDLLVSNFSTTGLIERAASEVILMNAMKHYFSYGVSTCCGIPEITLLGAQDDWASIVERTRNLAEFDCKEWIDVLVPCLEHFVAAFKGNADPTHWGNFYKSQGGSGGPFVNGWINTLFPYLSKYKMVKNSAALNWGKSYFGPNPDEFPGGMCSVPFTWMYHGQDFSMQFGGGFAGSSQDEKTLALSPAIGWAVADAV